MWFSHCPEHALYTHNKITALISVFINGESRAFDHAPNCAELVDALQLAGKRIAMERNGEIVPRSRFGDCVLQDGDRLEIVVAVGGG